MEKSELNALIPLPNQLKAKGVPLRTLGIDLGTTNSTVAELSWPGDGRPIAREDLRCLEIAQPTDVGEYTHILVPSVVAFANGQLRVGEGAKRLRARTVELGLEQNRNIFWECKNDIGIRRTYHRAPQGFRSAAEIAGHVLGFIARAAGKGGTAEGVARPPDRLVVTVPASFQAAQRGDTLAACRLAGLDVQPGDLLDEPLAAFLDFANRKGLASLGNPGDQRNLLVFDFGGGTCDIAIFRVKIPRPVEPSEPLSAASLAVSRYHRLGGGDVDAAIVHEVLVPQLCEQNGLAPFDLSFEDKSKGVAPAFLGLADALKIGLCSEIWRLRGLGRYEGADKSAIRKTQPGSHPCRLPSGQELVLAAPHLDAAQFEKLLGPFLDDDLLFPKEDEYRTTLSIFAPISDAIVRAHLTPRQVHACLLVGGSSLIPQVVDAVSRYLPDAAILHERDPEIAQGAVARGAALHALALAMTGKGVIDPVTGDSISIRTTSGLVPLVGTGTSLPFPRGEAWATNTDLSVPETRITGILTLRVELADSSDRPLMVQAAELPAPLIQGQRLAVSYRMDENQDLHFKVALDGDLARGEWTFRQENPLSNVVNPQPKRQRVLEIEETLRTTKLPEAKTEELTEEAANLYGALGQREKALTIWRRLLAKRGSADPGILNRMGILAGELGDAAKEEKYYREASAADRRWGTPLFNLALSRKGGRWAEALDLVNQALERNPSAPYRVLRAEVREALKDRAGRDGDLREALAAFAPISAQTDWELFWYLRACRMAGEDVLRKAVEAEQLRRGQKGAKAIPAEGLLPDVAPALTRPN